MENYQDKILSNIKSRVQNHEPDEYTNADWAEMEALLNAEEKKPFYINGQFLKRLSIFLLIGTVSFGLWSLNASKTASLSEQKNDSEIVEEDLNSNQVLESKNTQPTLITENEADLEIKEPRKSTFENQQNQTTITRIPKESNWNNQILETKKKVISNGFNSESKVEPDSKEELNKTVENVEQSQDRSLLSLFEISSISLNKLENTPSFKFNKVDIYNGPNRLLLGKWNIGFLFGINGSITDYQDYSISVMPHIGLFASKTLNRKLEFQAEAHLKTIINYNEIQTYEEDVFSSIGWIGYTKLQYTYRGFTSLDIPLTLKYALGRRFGILAGGRVSFIKAHEPAERFSFNGLYSGPSLQERVPKKGFWDQDVGFVLGAEYYLNTKWLLDVRYNQGFKDITPDNLYENTETHLNTDLQISVRRFF